MLAGAVVRDVVGPGQAVLQVVGGQHRVVADLAQAGPAVRPDVGVGAHEDAGVADEAAQPPDRARPLAGALEPERPVVLAQDAWRRQVRQQRLPHPDRAGARAAAAVRRRERLVDVEVHDVEAGLARLEPAEDRVEVRAVHVGQRAGRVDRVEQLADPRLEQPERRRVGDHDRRRPRSEGRPEARRGRRRRRRPTGRSRSCSPAIEAVAGLVPWLESGTSTSSRSDVPARPVVGPDHQDPGQLALRAGRGLEA